MVGRDKTFDELGGGGEAFHHDMLRGGAEGLLDVLAGFVEDEVFEEAIARRFEFAAVSGELFGVAEGGFFFVGV